MEERENRKLAPRNRVRITDKFVRKMEPKAHAWDIDQRGFGVTCSPNGLKSFIVAYRIDLRERRFTIGSHPGWSVAAARDEAGRIRQQADLGIDHIAEAQSAQQDRVKRKALTVKKALEELVTDKHRNLRDTSKACYRDNVTTYLADWLDTPLYEITGNDILARYEDILDGRNMLERRDHGKFAGKDESGVGYRTLRGGVASAKNTIVSIRAIWNYANWKHPYLSLGDPPTKRLPRGWNAVRIRDRVLADHDIKTFVEACRSYGNRIQADLALLLLYTGLRKGEASALRWSEIDIDKGILRISAERMKGRKTLEIPINKLALEILRRRHTHNCRPIDFVFPGKPLHHKKESTHATISRNLIRHLDEAVGTHTSPHDWRRTYTTIALGVGVPLYAVEVLTAHVATSGPLTVSTYYKPSINDLRTACRKIEYRLRELIQT